MNYMRQINILIFDEDPFSKGAKVIAMIMHEVIISMKFIQTNPQVRSWNINYFDL